MRRIIDFSLMGEVALQLKKQIEDLKNKRNQLLLDVDKISEGYRGIDATVIVNKYKGKIGEIDNFISKIEKYQICFEWLSGNYKNSHDTAESSLAQIEPNAVIDDVTTINLNNMVGGEYNG